MKNMLLLIAAAFLVGLFSFPLSGADTRDGMVKNITNSGPSTLDPTFARASHALATKDNDVLLNAYDGTLKVEGSNKDAYETALVFDEPTADRTIRFSNATGRVEMVNVTAKTATATLTSAECYGGIFTNTGASGAIVLTLPTPAAGMHIRVYLTAAQDVDLNAANGTQILALTNATGDAISSAATIGNSIELVGISATQWVAFAASGTWTDVN